MSEHYDNITRDTKVAIELMRAIAGAQRKVGLQPAGELELEIRGEITSAKTDALIAKLHANALAERVWLVIDSEGGNARTAFKLWATLRGHPGRVTTVAPGICASAATTIFLAGHERLAMRNASFHVHPTRDASESENQATDEVARYVFWMRPGADRSEAGFCRYCTADAAETPLTADEAVGLGIATEVTDNARLAADQAAFDAIPDSYSITTIGGAVHHMPLNRRAVLAAANSMRGVRCGNSLMVGMPAGFSAAAMALAGVHPEHLDELEEGYS